MSHPRRRAPRPRGGHAPRAQHQPSSSSSARQRRRQCRRLRLTACPTAWCLLAAVAAAECCWHPWVHRGLPPRSPRRHQQQQQQRHLRTPRAPLLRAGPALQPRLPSAPCTPRRSASAPAATASPAGTSRGAPALLSSWSRDSCRCVRGAGRLCEGPVWGVSLRVCETCTFQ
jgi:hypothetical protein